MISELFAIMAPIAIAIAVGYCWGRSGTEYPADFISRIVMYVGNPCLIIASMAKVQVDAGVMGEVMLATAVVMTIMGVLSALILKACRLDIRAYLPPLVFPNNGNMGLPLCLFAFGELGLALALGSFIVMMIATFTLGLVIVSDVGSGWRGQLFELAKQPVLYAMVVAIGMLVSGVALPRWIDNTVNLIGGFSIPLMIITLGVSLSSLKIAGIKKSIIFSVARIFGGFLIAYFTCWMLSVEGVSRSVVLIQSAMPVAVFNYLLALRYDRRPEGVATMVVVSTLLAFVTLPLLLTWLLPQ